MQTFDTVPITVIRLVLEYVSPAFSNIIMNNIMRVNKRWRANIGMMRAKRIKESVKINEQFALQISQANFERFCSNMKRGEICYPLPSTNVRPPCSLILLCIKFIQ